MGTRLLTQRLVPRQREPMDIETLSTMVSTFPWIAERIGETPEYVHIVDAQMSILSYQPMIEEVIWLLNKKGEVVVFSPPIRKILFWKLPAKSSVNGVVRNEEVGDVVYRLGKEAEKIRIVLSYHRGNETAIVYLLGDTQSLYESLDEEYQRERETFLQFATRASLLNSGHL